ncbi:MAG: dockerin type I domain-containing protein [Usitatibacteraceae bacterium]
MLDLSYANGVVTALPSGYSSVASVTGLSDGSGIYMAGVCGIDAAAAMCVARFLSAGQMDTTFGSAGYLTADLASSGLSEAASAVVVTYDQKYVVGGTCTKVDGSTNACLLRYKREGGLDSTFGSGGSAIVQIGVGSSSIASLVVTGPKISALGRCVRASGEPSETCAFRFNEDGTLDSSFGVNGIAPLPVPMSIGLPDYNLAGDGPPPTAIASQNGKLVIAGKCVPGKGALCLARLNADGSPDLSLGGAGFVTLPVHGLMNVGSVLVTANQILVGASCAEAFWYQLDYCVVRINEGGTLDTSFGTAGVAAYRTGAGGYQEPPSMAYDGERIVVASLCGGAFSGVCWSVLDQNGAPKYAPGKSSWGSVRLAEPYSQDIRITLNQGRMVVAGTCRSTPYTICASGFGLDGVLDANFGTAGHLVIPFTNISAALRAIAMDAGSLVLAGDCENSGQSDVCLARVALAPGAPMAPLIFAAGPKDSSALVSFSPPVLDGGSAITLYKVVCEPGSRSATGTASPILVTGLVNGTTYGCSVSATNSAGVSQASDSLSVTPSSGAVIALLGAVSRKTHGAAGDQDLNVNYAAPIDGQITVEPRAIGAGHTLVFRFDAPVTFPGTVNVVDRLGKSIGSATAAASGSDSVVTIVGVPDSTRVTVALSGVNGGTTDFFISLGFLSGDFNSSRTVNSSDISAVKARSGQVTDAGNFRFDINLSGTINSSDISAVKSRSGLALP